jgi:hypothetical protein
MITCEFIKISEDMAQCTKCGNVIQILDDFDMMPFFPCGSAIDELFDNDNIDPAKIKNRVTEDGPGDLDVANQCSDEEIKTRFEICKSCEHFDNNTCQQCGCILSRDKIFLNKLAWKDQNCPISKW